ncbi:hypothetical protein [Halomonas halocynthiae]|uniref:hypothetical protein n=1 Tax=Halomonas halocynthiae TaxID=176290 RepID=UPI0004869999|nr:hypothetical protein [Halomonas halocynthiae]
MPWRNSGLLQEMLLAFTLAGAVIMGFIAKIAAEIKSGEREKFFTRRLLLDVPAMAVMFAIAAGVSERYGLVGWQSTGVGMIAGYVGPRGIDIILMAVADRVRGGK